MASKEFVLATRSHDKVAEILDVLGTAASVQLVTLTDLHLAPAPAEDDVENFPTFIANALAKANYFARVTGKPTIADDSGLMVDALDGRPGVRTKRFAIDNGYTGPGGKALDEANNDMLLEHLRQVPEDRRGARYVCAAAVVWPNSGAVSSIGTCAGVIIRQRQGNAGFGYDPLFYIPELQLTFAQLTRAQKNESSHRARAFRALAPHLK